MMEQKNESIDGTAITVAPSNVTAVAIDAGNVLITWSSVLSAAGYHVFRGTTSDGPYQFVQETTSLALVDTGLAANTTYYYRITAYDADGDGPMSEPAIVTTAASDVPQNLIAAANGSTTINTTWDPIANASRYHVYRSTTAVGPYVLIGITTTTSYTNVGLIPNTTYYYRVTAVVNEVESAQSNTASATTDADIPVPTNVAAMSVSSTQIITTWDAVPNATAYSVYRSTSPNGTYQLVGTTADLTYMDSGLTPNTTYYYRVAATVDGVLGNASAYAAATTHPLSPTPSAPTNVQLQALSCAEILITWEASAGADGYYIYRSNAAGGPYQLIGNTADTAYVDAPLSPSTVYYYFIQAYTQDQFSPQSASVGTSTPSCESPVPPCRPCCCPCCGCDPCGCLSRIQKKC
ncbi:hypothetical protein GSF08_10175 [Clostridiaceae bacterium DONG20-135]|uniref:Fibronectin type-III domain-containing protein n=1 Tax=Copranaerobaculum intestinale TaxID=2692629 RepID=A0A6N8U8T2_9FIRM|nr:hypothetical protein [Copranaerobaculum intestinale]MXQ74291.1 hypothetical protein [Copranaerobaculum intestinale]